MADGAMAVGQDWRYVLLSYVVAVIASFTALELARPAAEASDRRGAIAWTFGGTVALAIGVWSMHFVGMQAFRIPALIAYDVPLVVASFVVALGGAVVALWMVVHGKASREIVIAASVLLGLCLAGMHYTGMASLRIAAYVRYDVRWVAVSVLIAIATSYAAFELIGRFTRERRLRQLLPEAATALVLGLAIISVHYAGMAAAHFYAAAPPSGGAVVDQSSLATVVGIATLAVLALFLIRARVNVVSHASHREHERYRSLADSVPNIMWTAAKDGTIEYCNRRFLEYTGDTLETIAVCGWESIIHPADRSGALAAWNTALASGVTYRADARLRRADGAYRWHVMLATPVHDAAGVLTKWFGSCTDIEEQKDAERIVTLLGEVTQRLTASLDRAGIAGTLASLVAPSEARYCEVQLYDGAALITTATAGDAAAFSFDSMARAESARRVGASLLTRELSVVPIHGAGSVLGWLVCCDVVDDVRAVVPELAARLGAALVNAQAYAREHRVAASFQTAALVDELPSVPGLRFSALYEAAEADAGVGGDWYDAFRLPDGRVVFSVGDVAGSGLDAAVAMSSVRQSIRTAALINPNPAAVLDAVDRIVRAMGSGRFVTAFVGVLDPVCEEFSFANAGHPPAIMRYPDGTLIELAQHDLPLGLRQRDAPPAATVELRPGSLIVAYTDGLIEFDRDPVAGHARLIDALGRCPEEGVAERVFELVAHGAPARDDIAVLAIRFDASLPAVGGAAVARRWSFDVSDGERAAAVRTEYVAALEAIGLCGAVLHAAELVFGELVGNAFRYARGEVDLILDLSGSAPVLHVLDCGAGFELNPRLPADPYSERGRGLFLVNSFADEFSSERRRNGGSHARAVLAGSARRTASPTMTRTAL